MPMIITPESALGIEMAKWEKPYVFRPFPQMLYMAHRRPDGIVSVCEVEDRVLGGTPGAAESFNRTCQRVVKTEGELSDALERGWRPSPQEALERFEAKESSIATTAAHRAYEDRNMGEQAKKEAAALEAEEFHHVAEVPEKRRARRTA